MSFAGVVGQCLALLAVTATAREASSQVVSPNLHVSAGACPELESEPEMATLGLNAVAVWFLEKNDDAVCAAISRDGGVTWTPAPIIRDAPSEFTINGHATVCIDGAGTVYCAMSGFGTDGTDGGQTAHVYRGSFADAEWQWQRLGDATPYFSLDPDNLDGLKILCDRSSGTLYLAYTRKPQSFQGRIQFIRSLDGGGSWSQPLTLSAIPCNTPQMVLAPGGELYVVWEDYGQRAIVGRKSTDSGESFGPEFRVAAIADNIGFGPPGWRYSAFRIPTIPSVPCMDFPAFLGLAVDTTQGPRRGALYATWTEHGLGAAQAEPTRVISEVEPNHNLGSATPIQIGDNVSGTMADPDQPPFLGDCDVFTFEGTAGTTLQITGAAGVCTRTGCRAAALPITLVCGSDTTRLTRVGCSQVFDGPIPTMIYTLPTTGRYYIAPACGFPGSTSYVLKLREYAIPQDQPARDHRDVLLSSSSDGGATWSPKARVNDDAPLHDNAIPAVAVDGLGQVHVAWYDRREEPECGARVHTYWTWSEDGGATFQPSRRVSEQASEGGSWDGFFQHESRWIVGDHMALHAEGDRVHLLWTHIPIGGGGEIYGVTITDLPTSVLVSRFEAEVVDGRVVVLWRVADGQGVQGFRVSRAMGRSEEYAPIGTVAASGRSEYTLEDHDVVAGARYRYRLEVLRSGEPVIGAGPVEVALQPRAVTLRWLDAVPNPFDDVVELTLESTSLAATRVRVFDAAGHLVAELRPQAQGGRTWVRWNGRNSRGRSVAPGVYLMRAETSGGEHATRRVIRMR